MNSIVYNADCLIDMKDFKKFDYMFTPFELKILKKDEAQIEKEARSWFKENFNADFNKGYIADSEGISFYWNYSVGLLMFGVAGLGSGGKSGCYYYKFIIRMLHFAKWGLPEYKQGFKYGRLCMKTNNKNAPRNGNPYSEIDFYRHGAWDAGFIAGLHNKVFKFKAA